MLTLVSHSRIRKKAKIRSIVPRLDKSITVAEPFGSRSLETSVTRPSSSSISNRPAPCLVHTRRNYHLKRTRCISHKAEDCTGSVVGEWIMLFLHSECQALRYTAYGVGWIERTRSLTWLSSFLPVSKVSCLTFLFRIRVIVKALIQSQIRYSPSLSETMTSQDGRTLHRSLLVPIETRSTEISDWCKCWN